MKQTVLKARGTTPEGASLTLHEHDGDYFIRVGGVELMSTRQHHSEERLAQLACKHIGTTADARVLIGGLGLGFTLRTTLRHLGPEARVTVAEIVPEVIAWNADPAYGLGVDALRDPRVQVVAGDVADVMRRGRAAFDAVILDVDNGAGGLSAKSNDRLYTVAGIELAKSALRVGGCLAIWSATDDPAFVERMRRGGFDVITEKTRVQPAGGGWAWLFIGRTKPGGGRSRSPNASSTVMPGRSPPSGPAPQPAPRPPRAGPRAGPRSRRRGR